jgi:hypothetical protein
MDKMLQGKKAIIAANLMMYGLYTIKWQKRKTKLKVSYIYRRILAWIVSISHSAATGTSFTAERFSGTSEVTRSRSNGYVKVISGVIYSVVAAWLYGLWRRRLDWIHTNTIRNLPSAVRPS